MSEQEEGEVIENPEETNNGKPTNNYLKKKRKRKSSSSIKKKFNIDLPIGLNASILPNTKNTYIITKTKIEKFNTNNFLFSEGRMNLKDQDPSSRYAQRYYYFSLFDQGIKMDDESWYSVTPEEIAIYIAGLVKDNKESVITDAFCGCGGNVIQFSKTFKSVNAVDISKDKIELTQNNSSVYSCPNNITYYHKDFFDFNIKSDYLFLSPPWGGEEYKNDEHFSLKKWIHPDIEKIISHSFELSNNLILYLPRNTNINELAELLYKYDKENIDSNYDCLYLDVQYIYSANKIKAMVVLYGDEFNSVTIKEIRLYISEMFKNENMNKDKLRRMINMAKCLGACRFFKELFIFKEQNKNGKSDKFMKYIENQVMDKEDKEEYTQLCAQKKEVKNEEKEATKIYTSMNEEEYNRAILNVI